MSRPPRLAAWLLARLLPDEDRDEVLGDLAERWERRLSGRRAGPAARIWYWRQALGVPLWMLGAGLRRIDVRTLEIGPTLRRLARSPGFTLVAVASLALGIGANTATFSVLDALLHTPLRVERPHELRLVYHTRPTAFGPVSQYNSSQDPDPETGGQVSSNVSYPIFRALRDAAAPEIRVAAFTFLRQLSVVIDERPALSAAGTLASGDYFETLEVGIELGRGLLPSDDDPSAPLVAVVSHGFWQRAFGGDPNVVGRTVRLNGSPVEIVGVTAPGFEGLSPGGFFPRTDITVPLSAQPLMEPRWTPEGGSLFESTHRYWIRMVARVPENVPADRSVSAMTAALRRGFLESEVIEPAGEADARIRLLPGERGLDTLRVHTERPLRMLAGIAGLVLVVACANVATLLLARGHARRREMAVRKALGGRRGQVAWPVLLESLLVTAAGAVAGVALAWWGAGFVSGALTAGLGAGPVELTLDARLLAITGALSVLAALASGLFPALRATAVPPFGSMAGRGAGREGRSWVGRGLVVVQIAVSVPLVVGAGLLVRSVGNLGAVEPGFEPAGLTLFRIDPSLVARDREETIRLFREVTASVAEIAGVRDVSLVENVLLGGWVSNTSIEIGGERQGILMNAVGPGFADALGIRLLVGRTPTEAEHAAAAPVVVVNRSAAERLFGGAALGRTFRRDGREVRVIGVVADTRYQSLRSEAEPTMFDPWEQRASPGALHVAVRAPRAGPELEGRLREAVARVRPDLPVTDLRSQADRIRDGFGRETVFARLLALFGGFVLLLACIGLHGVTSYAVSRRVPEMGVRLAMGAKPRKLLGLVLGRVLGLTVTGLGAGLVASYLLSPILGSLLYGLEPYDPATFAGAALTMVAVAVAAGGLPAWRAARTDPLKALGSDA